MKKKKKNINLIILLSFVSLSFILYIVSNFIYVDDFFNIYEAIKIVCFSLIIGCFVVSSYLNSNKRNNIFIFISSLVIIMFCVISMVKNYSSCNNYSLINFYNMSISDVYSFKNKYNIDIKEVYEFSDTISEYHVISQDIPSNTSLNDISSLTLLISRGIDYDKNVIVPSFIGWDFDKVINYLLDNHLENVEFYYLDSNNEIDSVIKQEGNGTRKRSDLIKIYFSKSDVVDDLVDLKDKHILYAKAWLSKNGYKYDISYDNNDSILKNYVISSEFLDDKVNLVVSTGKIIKVPNLLSMSVDDINKWIMANNLKIDYKEVYSEDIKLGDIIDSNYKENDIIESGSLVSVSVSKGRLEMIKYTDLDSFIDFCTKENINYDVVYDYSDKPKDSLISSTHKEGEVIKNGDNVIITISKGKKVIVPNFVNMSKDKISQKCKELNLSCSFSYGGFTESVNKDICIKQSKTKDSVVSEGVSIVITLSSGKYVKVNVPSFSGKNKSQIESSCKSLGVTCKFVYDSKYSSIAKDMFVKQSASGTVNKGSTITITLTKGPAKEYTFIVDANMLAAGNPEATKSKLKSVLDGKFSDVKFVYEFKTVNTGKGYLTSDSQVKVGKNVFKQGQTYKVIIGN